MRLASGRSRQASSPGALAPNPVASLFLLMYLCYVDESGTPDIPGNTSHYVLAALAFPDEFWKSHHAQLENVKRRYGLAQAELHVAWMLRPYIEQHSIPNFAQMAPLERRSAVLRARTAELLRLQRVNRKQYKQTKKNYQKTQAYIHLTYEERHAAVKELAQRIASWGAARLFAECIDKIHFDPIRTGNTVDGQAFEQIVSRFERFLNNSQGGYGLLVHDNNETVAKRHTQMMKGFLESGTLWTQVHHVIETPMFVDSQLTGMVQLADLCAYALRRYLENAETELFDLIFQRADKIGATSVGVRHYTKLDCPCRICASHSP